MSEKTAEIQGRPAPPIYLLEDTTEDKVIELVPDKCPECGCTRIRIEGCSMRTNDPYISSERDKLLLGIDGDYVLYMMAFGWFCDECGREEFFDHMYRIAWT